MAVTVTPGELAEALGYDDIEGTEPAGRIIALATAMMERYMGSAERLAAVPDPICNNAVLRVAGWLRDAPRSSARILVSTRAAGMEPGQRPAEYPYEWVASADHATASPLRQCGAMALLSPYKRRRAR